MIRASRKFQKKINRGAVDPIGLFTVFGTGQVAKLTTEADWGTNTFEADVDYDATYKDITAGNYVWDASASGTNEYYCQDSIYADPSLAPQNTLIMDNVWLTKGVLGSLADHEFGYGDNDALGFNTIYVADATGDPDVSGVVIEINGSPPDTAGDCVLAADNAATRFLPAADGIFATTDEVVGNVSFNGAPTGWECVDDPYGSPDDETTYIRFAAGHHWYGGGLTASMLQAIPENAVIRKVTVAVRVRHEATGTKVSGIRMKYDGVLYNIADATVTTSYADYAGTYIAPPSGTGVWTREKLALIQGIGFYATGTWHRMTQCYLRIEIYDYKTTGTVVLPFDLGADANTGNKAIISINDYIPTGTNINYTIEGSATGAWGGEEVALGAITDGSVVTGYRYYRITATFYGTATLTPVLNLLQIDLPDNTYKFSTKPLPDIAGSLPYLNNVPGRSLKVNFTKFISTTSNMTMSLQNVEAVKRMLRQEPMKGRHALVNIGLGKDSKEKDLIEYYQGQVIDYKQTEKAIILSLKDPTKNLDNKIPQPPTGAGTTVSIAITYNGTHMVDVLLDILDKVGVAARWIDRASFEVVRNNIGNGIPAPVNYIVKRMGTNIINKPTKARDMVEELLEIMGCYLIVQENGKLQLIEYDATAAAVDTWTDTDFINPVYRPKLESSLFNICAVFYDDDGDGNYTNVYGDFDLTSTGKYGNFIKTIKTSWLAGDAADGYYGEEIAGATAIREVARLANGQGIFTGDTNLSKALYQQGEYINIISAEISRYNERDDTTRKFIIVGKGWKFNSAAIKWTLAEVR